MLREEVPLPDALFSPAVLTPDAIVGLLGRKLSREVLAVGNDSFASSLKLDERRIGFDIRNSHGNQREFVTFSL